MRQGDELEMLLSSVQVTHPKLGSDTNLLQHLKLIIHP